MTSRARRAALERYMLEVRDVLRLQAWDVSVSDEPPSEEAVLTITPHLARHTGTVRIGSFFLQDRDEQRQTVVHELVHLVQASLWEWWDDEQPWHARLAGDQLAEVKQRVHYELEVQADFLARLLAPLVPLPPARWP